MKGLKETFNKSPVANPPFSDAAKAARMCQPTAAVPPDNAQGFRRYEASRIPTQALLLARRFVIDMAKTGGSCIGRRCCLVQFHQHVVAASRQPWAPTDRGNYRETCRMHASNDILLNPGDRFAVKPLLPAKFWNHEVTFPQTVEENGHD